MHMPGVGGSCIQNLNQPHSLISKSYTKSQFLPHPEATIICFLQQGPREQLWFQNAPVSNHLAPGFVTPESGSVILPKTPWEIRFSNMGSGLQVSGKNQHREQQRPWSGKILDPGTQTLSQVPWGLKRLSTQVARERVACDFLIFQMSLLFTIEMTKQWYTLFWGHQKYGFLVWNPQITL